MGESCLKPVWVNSRHSGITLLRELLRVRARKDAIAGSVRLDDLDDHVVEGLPDDGPRPLASQEPGAEAGVRPAPPAPTETDPEAGALGHVGPSLRSPAARSCCSRWARDLNMPPFALR